eukprot:scaffold5104_cov28-Tisochrysis_lutea.AAC.3
MSGGLGPEHSARVHSKRVVQRVFLEVLQVLPCMVADRRLEGQASVAQLGAHCYQGGGRQGVLARRWQLLCRPERS